MSITDFGDKSKDEIIEYLIDERNATERETAKLRQELAEAKETIEEFKRMIFASRSEKKHVGYENRWSAADYALWIQGWFICRLVEVFHLVR